MRIAVDVDDSGPRPACNTQRLLEEALGRIRIAMSTEQKVNCGARNRRHETRTSTSLSLEHTSHLPAKSRWSALIPGGSSGPKWKHSAEPTPDGGMVGAQAALRQKFLHIAIGQRKSQVPAHRAGNHTWFEVSPFEQLWPLTRVRRNLRRCLYRKGYGPDYPGLTPDALGETYEYYPTLTELRVAVGIFAFGFLLFTLMLKVAAPISLGEFRDKKGPPVQAPDAAFV